MNETLPRSLEGLLGPGAYSHPIGEVELVTTHISWIFLAGDYAYKIKRPVCYPFIDLTSLERRRFLCQEELRLNRRFAPELYLEVCRVVAAEGMARMGGPDSAGEPGSAPGTEAILDYAVRMRRFPRAEELDRLLDARRIEPQELERFGHELAQLHARLPAAPAASIWGKPKEVQAHLLHNLLECADAARVFGSSAQVLALRDALQVRLAAATPWMSARRSNGRIRECHGDLHSRNIVRVRGRLVPFDCLEYDPALRWIDTADEIAFLTSDMKARERPLRAHAFRTGYLAASGDYHACRVLTLYEAHRALVRAKVAALSAMQNADASAREALRLEYVSLLTFTAQALEPKAPHLFLMSGLSGSGKTWLARQLAARLSAVHIRSDVERKRRAGLRPLASSNSQLGKGLYTPEATAALYEDLARAADDVLSGDIPAIVDATFLERAQRAPFVELAASRGVSLHLICCGAPEALLRTRIMERSRTGNDPSEASLDVLAWQSAHAEPVMAEEGIDVIPADTAGPDVLDQTLRKIGSALSDGRLDQP